MDGVDPDTHDDIRGKKGSFAKALKNLEYLKNNRKNGKPHIAVRGVLMKENFKMMPDYIAYFNNIVDDISFQPIHNNSSHHEVVDHEVLFSPRDMQFEAEFEQMMHSVAGTYPEFDNDYYRSFPQFVFHPEEMEEKALHTCLPTWMNFMPITDDGTCHTCTQVIGNVFENDIEKIWCGEKRIGFLRSMAKFGKCKSPCWLNCTGVAPGWIGTGIKTLLKLGQENERSRQEFLQMPNYTGAVQS
jgi:MoaA/NifB/PqqE/SkfB family radical SAM enzyme